MWNFGNELPLGDQLIDRLNTHMDFIRTYTYAKWNRTIPVTLAVVDNPFSYEKLYNVLRVDVFSTNAGYRGLGFSGNFLKHFL
jgi:hypothetical protein